MGTLSNTNARAPACPGRSCWGYFLGFSESSFFAYGVFVNAYSKPFFSFCALTLFATLGACSGGSTSADRVGSSGGGGNDGGASSVDGNTATGAGGVPIITLDPPEVPNPCEAENAPEECELVAPPACGDGSINLDPPEACDDGNSLPGDGCSGGCKIEPYFECPTPGAPCVSTIICGDAAIGPGEACDDGNETAGDGCADDCKSVEIGYRCRL